MIDKKSLFFLVARAVDSGNEILVRIPCNGKARTTTVQCMFAEWTGSSAHYDLWAWFPFCGRRSVDVHVEVLDIDENLQETLRTSRERSTVPQYPDHSRCTSRYSSNCFGSRAAARGFPTIITACMSWLEVMMRPSGELRNLQVIMLTGTTGLETSWRAWIPPWGCHLCQEAHRFRGFIEKAMSVLEFRV